MAENWPRLNTIYYRNKIYLFLLWKEKRMRCPEILKRLFHLWEEYTKEGYILGLSYVTRQRPWFESLPWFILLLASIPLTGYFVVELIEDWRSNHVQITMKSMSYPIQKIPFPTLTLCPPGYSMSGYSQRFESPFYILQWLEAFLIQLITSNEIFWI